MPPQSNHPERLDIGDTLSRRLLVSGIRALAWHCPFCGTSDIFRSWFAVKDRCPHCGTTYAYETGYFLGAYAINLVFTELLAVAIVVSLIAFTDLSVLQMQIIALIVAVGLPLLFYPIAPLLWIALDIAFHPPDKRTGRHTISSEKRRFYVNTDACARIHKHGTRGTVQGRPLCSRPCGPPIRERIVRS